MDGKVENPGERGKGGGGRGMWNPCVGLGLLLTMVLSRCLSSGPSDSRSSATAVADCVSSWGGAGLLDAFLLRSEGDGMAFWIFLVLADGLEGLMIF